jgi:hypothetical protein
MVARLLDRAKLVVAVSEEIPVEVKLELQPLIRELAGALSVARADQNLERVASYYQAALVLGEEYPDVTALLGAVGNFVDYL